MPVILLFPPNPLHLDYLGAASDAIDNAENKYPCEMREEFFAKHNLKKSGGGPGGKFAGPSIKKILQEENLVDLEIILPDSEYGVALIESLKIIRELHRMCTAMQLLKILDNISSLCMRSMT